MNLNRVKQLFQDYVKTLPLPDRSQSSGDEVHAPQVVAHVEDTEQGRILQPARALVMCESPSASY